MKNLMFFLFTALFITACSKTEEKNLSQQTDCEEGFNFENLPPSSFLDGYYELLISEFTRDQLTSCACSDLLSIQDFKNTHLPNFRENYMEMSNSCEYLQDVCSYYTNLDPQVLIDSFSNVLQHGVNNNLVSIEEAVVMSEFYEDYFKSDNIDFDYYWCKLLDADKTSVINQSKAGLAGAFTLTVFQSRYEFIENNPQYFNSDEIQLRWWKWIRDGILWDLAKKYPTSMYICYEGIRDGVDTSHDAIDAFID